ncbi:diguanylate cyclase (GGDEF)-like protein [Azospirillum fermentarium]|uniref:GGDEF domain-containing protein n=1 Tax=Azospirillum fermentarium TaxID=1233114 RepID=UPI0022268F8A|nr:GGDEF domain-containing protein [Azospirillum fermentarium]MCW2245065.1 diguanylate cyclase (GGDEF)-like protein [Azospirillum fermentarium]
MSGDLSLDQLRDLIHPRHHTTLIQRRRAVLIHSRVRMVAAAFAVLTPLWIIIDIMIFDWPLWGWLAALRVVASASFGALALGYRITDDIGSAWRGLALLLAVPTFFFLFSHPVLNEREVSGISGAIGSGYAFLPFVMVAGLSVFPITAVEGFLFALPMLAAHLGAGMYGSLVFPFPHYLGALWLLVLIMVVATLAGMSQLHFMMALVDQASHDGLTGAFGRRIGEELLRIQFSHAQRSSQPLTLVFVDLDNFKQVNDRHGHDEGDRVLRDAAESLRAVLRTSDILIRWGGEEFLVVLPNTGTDGALRAVERLRTRGLAQRPDGTGQTASIGVAEFTEELPPDWETLVEVADHRMYVAKQSGKDRVVTAATVTAAA